MSDMGSCSNKAAHRVVSSPDLLSLIFSYFRPPFIDVREGSDDYRELQDYSACCGTLYRLATTCKAFQDPALALLWRRIVNLDDFLALFPGWTDLGSYVYDEAFIIAEDVTEDHWARARYYASFVREIYDTQTTWIHPYTWSVLARWCGREPLFPHLESLTRLRLSARSWCPLFFLSPALRHLDLVLVDAPGDEDAAVGNRLLNEIATLCPRLNSLRVQSDMEAATPSLNMIHRFVNLRSLATINMPLRLSELRALARFPHVEALSGTIAILARPAPRSEDGSEDSQDNEETGDEWEERAEEEDGGEEGEEGEEWDEEEESEPESDDAETQPGSSHALIADRPSGLFPLGSFPALKNLHVDGHVKDLKIFLRESLNVPLETLSVNVAKPTRPNKIRRLFAAIASYAPHTLRAFSLKYAEEPRQEPGRFIDMVRPLLSLSLLKSVEFSVVDLPHINDEDILEIAIAWTSLQVFRLPAGKASWRRMGNDTERPTHRALMYFAMHCPNLETLVLPDIAFDGSLFAIPLVKHRLKSLDFEVKDRTSAYPPVIAMVIDLVFPFLDLEHENSPPTPPGSPDPWRTNRLYDKRTHQWPKIKRFLRAIRAGRERGKSLEH
ncbi:hypothetical protein C8Q70DRAFT_1000212 [Cubamyces menziesii]|nr:hypothetical protein C8Q70DRAFT_1000212 [Cubamyces menziesii]